jgi:FkbM family methyltransferase
MSGYQLNTWLNPVVQAYEKIYGLTDKPVVWEVGSRDGHDGVELARRIYRGNLDWFWTNAKVVCIEANPDQVKVIHRNYPEAKVIHRAASNETGQAPFMVYKGDEGAVGSSSLDLEWKGDDLEGDVIQVQTVRLEELIKDEQIDIMAIDVEGYSMQVLEGLGDKLRQVKVFYIETEHWNNTYVQVKVFMQSQGYTLVSEEQRWGGMPELVFVRG